jgi:hypothetical protein
VDESDTDDVADVKEVESIVVLVQVDFIEEAIEGEDGNVISEGTGGRFFDFFEDVEEVGVGSDFSKSLLVEE